MNRNIIHIVSIVIFLIYSCNVIDNNSRTILNKTVSKDSLILPDTVFIGMKSYSPCVKISDLIESKMTKEKYRIFTYWLPDGCKYPYIEFIHTLGSHSKNKYSWDKYSKIKEKILSHKWLVDNEGTLFFRKLFDPRRGVVIYLVEIELEIPRSYIFTEVEYKPIYDL